MSKHNTRHKLILASSIPLIAAMSLAIGLGFGTTQTQGQDEVKRDRIEGEPTAVGYPVIRTKRDIEFAKVHAPKENKYRAKNVAGQAFNRTLRGNGFHSQADGLHYWYSNSDSSSYCDNTYLWHSGHVRTAETQGTCGVGTQSPGNTMWSIEVTD